MCYDRSKWLITAENGVLDMIYDLNVKWGKNIRFKKGHSPFRVFLYCVFSCKMICYYFSVMPVGVMAAQRLHFVLYSGEFCYRGSNKSLSVYWKGVFTDPVCYVRTVPVSCIVRTSLLRVKCTVVITVPALYYGHTTLAVLLHLSANWYERISYARPLRHVHVCVSAAGCVKGLASLETPGLRCIFPINELLAAPLSIKIRLSFHISNTVLCSSSSPPPDLKLSFIPLSLLFCLLVFPRLSLPPSVCSAVLSNHVFLSCGICLFYSHPGKQPDTTTINLSLCSLCLKISPSFLHQLFFLFSPAFSLSVLTLVFTGCLWKSHTRQENIKAQSSYSLVSTASRFGCLF